MTTDGAIVVTFWRRWLCQCY